MIDNIVLILVDQPNLGRSRHKLAENMSHRFSEVSNCHSPARSKITIEKYGIDRSISVSWMK